MLLICKVLIVLNLGYIFIQKFLESIKVMKTQIPIYLHTYK